LFESQAARIRGLAGHPESTIYAVGGDSGCLQIWNYASKEVIISRLFKESIVDLVADPKKKNPQDVISAISCIVFSPTGKTLGTYFS
jgi:hypothetical protein